ncbi:hypothetical protein CYMTET_48129 [Cymbomonas tetramitiformis]|uniref:Reverse transcriptase Ty1/copia-type domain-containing protein n=1 Tax=Cymbomonas tetramitiformis TaxID=36881 RepID=A0AAE0BUS3_9CHLO|nr:hypothetical protein CYMTET_48129 [Cymbomonas tetramitiformis]
MKTLLRQYRMRHETGPPYMHEFQAQIEVLWRDMQKIMNSTMRTYDAPLYTWPLAALHAINTVLNVMPNKHIGMDTPHLRYTGRHFDYTELRPFWSECNVWQDPAQRSKAGAKADTSAKLQPKSKPYRYVGNLTPGNYLCLDTVKGKLKALSRPTFVTDPALMAKTLADTHNTLVDPASTAIFTKKLYPIRRPTALSSPDILELACSTRESETFAYVKVQHRYQVYFDSADSHSTQYADTDAVIISPDQKAMLLALRDADSDPADFPSDAFMDEPDPATYRQAWLSPNWRQWHKAIQSEIDGILQPDRADPVTAFPQAPPSSSFKARCTTRGDMDRTFYEEAETFAPTPQLTTFRLLLALCLTHRLMPYHYDVSQAFLQALIPEDERYYVRSTYDECLYIGWIDGQLFIVLIYVDDFIVACADERSRARFHTDIMSTFQATYSGVLNQFLQLRVDVQTETLPTGESYPTRIELSHERSITDLTIRPDIYYHGTYLAQFCHQPTVEALTAAKRVLHYAYSTRDYTLAMTIDSTTPQLTAFCDSDHAGDTATRNSVSGYCLYFHGMLIDWKFIPVWIPTDDNQADIFTKALPTTKHGVPIIDKFTARLLDIKDRGVKLKERLRAAEARKLHAQQQQLQQQQRQDEIVLASLQRQNLIG